MYESADDFTALDALLQTSIDRAGPFLRSSFEMPEHSLSAKQLCATLSGMRTVAISTVTARGEPRVAPIGAFLYRGAFHIPTTMEAARVRHVRRQPAVSLTYFEGIDFAVIVHGNAQVIGEDDPTFDTLERIQRDLTGSSVRDWGTGAFIRVEANMFYSYVRYPEQFADSRQ